MCIVGWGVIYLELQLAVPPFLSVLAFLSGSCLLPDCGGQLNISMNESLVRAVANAGAVRESRWIVVSVLHVKLFTTQEALTYYVRF